MPRYNFYDIKGGAVPADLNEPVRKMLVENMNCPEAVKVLDEFEKFKNCGEIQIFDKKTMKNVTIKTNYGMVEGYDLVKTVNSDKYIIVSKKHIKNHNISMKKEVKNG
jgi:hypothetical protein